MNYGLSIKNPENDLVISSDGMGLACIGKAVLYGSVVQPQGSATGPSPGKVSGYSVYRINHAGPVVWAIDMPLNKRVGIISSAEVSSGLWEVVCYCGDTLDEHQFDDVQYELSIWAFGVVTSPPNSLKAHIYNAAGELAYDLTQPNMLFPKVVGLSVPTALNEIPVMGRAIVMGCPTSNPSYSTSQGTNRWASEFYRGVWERISATEMRESLASVQRWEYSATEPVDVTSGFISPTTYIFMDGVNLP